MDDGKKQGTAFFWVGLVVCGLVGGLMILGAATEPPPTPEKPGHAGQDLCRLCADLATRAADEHRMGLGRTQAIDDVMGYADDHSATEGYSVNFYTRSFVRQWVGIGYDFAVEPNPEIAGEVDRICQTKITK
jgi:hypothetical protein